MDLKHYFDIQRFWWLLKLEIYRSRKGIIMTFVITFGMLFFIGMLLDILVEDHKLSYEHHGNYAFTLIIGGFILSSLAFHDLGNTLKRYTYLTLPVSTFERFSCMWLLTSVGWIILFTIAYTVYSIVANLIGNLLFHYMQFQSFNPFNALAISAMRYYFVLQGIFLVGAALFRGYVFPKTLFAVILFAVACGFIAYLIMGDMTQMEEECITETKGLEQMPIYQVWLLVQWIFWWLLAPVSWIITFLGLKEQEA